ncbi:MAG: PQQ-like beta-propeller repeat protein [Alphaproteobacteria bacterium]|nr:PQQ-like beta-propeller repeat protein [Alphaproteobacteria bacterium]
MRKSTAFICCIVALCACDKHDPILPGVRTAIFDSASVKVLNQDITNVPETAFVFDNANCPYSQDSANVIWDGERRVFSGFATNNSVSSNQQPVCDGKYLYAGLTTGEVVKLNPKTRQIIWIADIYSISNLTGGASMVDIVAPVVPYKNSVYAGGLGNAFCKINANSGVKQWCVDISVPVSFTIAGDYAFVVGTDSNLYAISVKNGDVFWRTSVEKQSAPMYENGIVSVGKQRINAENGKNIK